MVDILLRPFLSLHRHGDLVRQLTAREVQSRFLGSVMGALWVVLVPVLMLLVYTFVFGLVFKARWPGGFGGTADFALKMFAGLIVFAFFGDVIGRAPRLVVDQPNFVKKVAFPLDCLAWVAIGAAGVTAVVGFAIFVVAVVLTHGQLLTTVFLVPLYMAPLVILTAGLAWIFAALGVYFRDLGQIVGVLVSALLFLTPVFYPTSAVPESYRFLVELNPLTFYAEAMRSLVLEGALPPWGLFGQSAATALALFVLGYAFFAHARQGFADVL